MEKGKNLDFQGKHYEFLNQEVRTLPNGSRVQITEYRVRNEDGSFVYPAFVCSVPDGYEYIELSSLSKSCLERFATEKVVELSEDDLQ